MALVRWRAPTLDAFAAVGFACGAPAVEVGPVRAIAPAPRRFALHAASRDTFRRLAMLDADDCRAALARQGARFAPLPDRATPDASGCGMPRGVSLVRGPTGITYAPALAIDCSLALELASVEPALQEEARRHLGAKLVRIVTLGGYACRPIRHGLSGSLSQHAFGDAADLAAFETETGERTLLSRDWSRPETRRGRFLRAIELRLRGDGGLSHVLGPSFNRDHRDHFHLDRAGA